MILIEERQADKLPGNFNLFIKFDYREDLVGIFRQLSLRNYDKNTKSWEIPINQLSYIVDLLIEYDDIKLRLAENVDDDFIDIPKGYKFKVKPFKHQIEGIQFGLNNDDWILGDDMGLGKSKQVIDLACILKEMGEIKHCLIICGVNSLKLNWAREIKTFSDEDYIILGERTRKKSGKKIIASVKDRAKDLSENIEEFFIITNVETLRSKEVIDALDKNINDIDMMVIDEVHEVKNPTSSQGKNILKLTNFKRKIALSGTLIVTNPLDAFVPLKWLGSEKSTFSKFKQFYCNYGGFRNAQIIGFKNLDILQNQLSKIMLRRTKEEVLDLPPKTYSIEYVEMNETQAKFYEQLKTGVIDEMFDMVNINPAYIQAIITRLRQATAYTGILSSTVKESAKLDRLESLVKQITAQGDKVLVFSTFKATVDEMQKRFKQYNPVVGTGDIKDDQIELNKQKFQTDENCKLFLATWQKMGTGHTLTAASYVIFIDTPWSDSEMQQAIDRAHRIGTTKTVNIITLITENTFDLRVQEIIEGKASIFNYLVNRTSDVEKEINKKSVLSYLFDI